MREPSRITPELVAEHGINGVMIAEPNDRLQKAQALGFANLRQVCPLK